MIPTLKTERLILRAPSEDDFPFYERFYTDSNASKFYGGPIQSHKAWTVLASELGHWQLRGYGRWVIENQNDGEVVGVCGFWWPQGWPRSELTWWLLPSGRGHGYATEASKVAISFAYDVLKWDLVQTHMLDENDAARRLVVRLGGKVIARETFPDGRERDIFELPNAAE